MLNPFQADLPWFLDGWIPIQFALVVGVVFAFRAYMKGGKCFSQAKLRNKVALITGGSGDIAKQVAIDLLRRGCQVVLACKDDAKGEAVKTELEERFPKAKVTVMSLDFCKLENVRKFAQEFEKVYEKLDILINCAGVMFAPFEKTEDGYELHFQINYLGHFLLTHLLLPLLRRSEEARIMNVSAVAHFAASIHFDDLNLEQGEYESRSAYSQSKLALVLFTRQLAKILADAGDENISVFAVHPGVCDTALFRHSPLGSSTFFRVMSFPFIWMLMKTAEDGAQTIVYCAVTEQLSTGKYYSDCEEKAMSEAANDDDVAQRLYDESMKMCGLGKQQ